MTVGGLANRYPVQMDTRGRISFPALYRAAIGDQLFISPDVGQRHYLVVRSLEGFNAYADKLREEGERYGDDSEEIENEIRDFASRSACAMPDKNGRITIPQKLLQYAELGTGTVYVIGMIDYAEIWSEERLKEYDAEREKIRIEKRRRKDAARAKRAEGDV